MCGSTKLCMAENPFWVQDKPMDFNVLIQKAH
jgi:hypothetical protein